MLRQVELSGTEADAAAWLANNGWTDGLPVVVPTTERVAAMVAATPLLRQHVLGSMAPLRAEVTVEKLAVVAVLAGCTPASFPIVVAAASAVLAQPFRHASVQSSTSPAAPLSVVNGPGRAVSGITGGTGCLGPAAGANVAVGRAVRLALQLIGGGHPGEADPATIGSPTKISMCFGENEESSPWPPLAERRGHPGRHTVVTVFAVTGLWQISDPSAASDDVAHAVLYGMISLGHCAQPRLPEAAEQLLLLSPPVASLVAAKFPQVEDLQVALFETVRVPLSWVAPYKRAATLTRLEELGLPRDERAIPLAESPGCFVPLVAGGPAGVQSIGMSTSALSRSASAIALLDRR